MGKKMKLPFLYRTTTSDSPPWPFPSCGNIRTHSFRATDIFRTINSAYVDNSTTITDASVITTPTTSTPRSLSSMSEDGSEDGDNEIETVIRGLKSERLFFEPGESNSIMDSSPPTRTTSISRRRDACGGGCNTVVPYEESVVLSMESKDPYVDFRKSMEEMVEAHGLKNWEGLEELLTWYLRVNGKNSHGYIISAFIDLLVSLSFHNSFITATTTNTTTTSSGSTSSSSSSLLVTSSSISPLSPLSLPSSSSANTPYLSSLDQEDDQGDEEADELVLSS